MSKEMDDHDRRVEAMRILEREAETIDQVHKELSELRELLTIEDWAKLFDLRGVLRRAKELMAEAREVLNQSP